MATADKFPSHIALILDGNARWARKKKRPVAYGHRQGVENVENILEYAADIGIKVITLYAFSSENWLRSRNEKSILFKLLIEFFTTRLQKIMEKGARIKIIGDLSRFNKTIQKVLTRAEDESKNNRSFLIQVALSYGGRDEIVRGVKNYFSQGLKAGKKPEALVKKFSEEQLARSLDTSGTQDPDLLIRTGGDYRISNFLLYQCAYTELYFTKTLWPDFSRKEFKAAINDFGKRERRFGGRNA